MKNLIHHDHFQRPNPLREIATVAPRTPGSGFKATLMAVAAFLMLAFSITAARADIDAQIAWTAKSVAGEVLYREGGEPKASWRALRKGGLLSALAELRTGADGRAVLAYEESTITVAPRSEFKLPAPAPKNAVYRVAQKFGTFLYKIKHAGRDKFEVRTPYLTTIIKGTIFSVNVSTRGAAVHVTEGAVFVQPKQGGNGAFVRPGQSAQVSKKSRGKVELKGLRSKGTTSKGPGGDKRSDAGNGASDGKGANHRGPRRVVKIVFRSVAQHRAWLTRAAANHNGGHRGRKGQNASIVALEASAFGLSNSGPGNNYAGGNGGGNGGGLGGGLGNSGPGNNNAGGNGGGLGGGNSNSGPGNNNAGGNGGGNGGGKGKS